MRIRRAGNEVGRIVEERIRLADARGSFAIVVRIILVGFVGMKVRVAGRNVVVEVIHAIENNDGMTDCADKGARDLIDRQESEFLCIYRPISIESNSTRD